LKTYSSVTGQLALHGLSSLALHDDATAAKLAPSTKSPILIRTKSQPRSLLSIAKSKARDPSVVELV
jgi:hypothetical protein